MDYARVEFILEPSEDLDVVLELPGVQLSREQHDFVEAAIYGFLDVVMTAEPYPLKKLKIAVVGAEFDPINSNMMAFRLAGRDAAKRLLEELRSDPYKA